MCRASASTPAAGRQRGPSLYPMRATASLGKPPLSPARSASAALPSFIPLGVPSAAPGPVHAVPPGTGAAPAGAREAAGAAAAQNPVVGLSAGSGPGPSSAAALARLHRLSGNGGGLSKSDSAHDGKGQARLAVLPDEHGSGKA